MTAQQYQLIDQTLASSGLMFTRPHQARWQAELIPGCMTTLLCEEDTLCLDVDLGPHDFSAHNAATVARRLLECSGVLPGNAKFCVNPEGRLHIAAELLTPDLEVTPQELTFALDGLQAGIRFHSQLISSGEGWVEVPPNPPPGFGAAALEEAAALSGWPFRKRDDGALVFELEGDPALRQAVLAGGGSAAARLAVPVTVDGRADAVLQPAFTELMLRANALLLGPRAALRTTDQAPVAVIERTWHAVPGSEALLLALESLNVASHTVGYELRALILADLASAYREMGRGT